MNGCAYEGELCASAVRTSLVVLKALTYLPTGGIVAAPTTSLPEQIGGVRNWDYRYCWLRDATFTLYALMNAGYIDEARAWRDWLLRAVAGDPAKAQILYGVGGQRRIAEFELDWLPGYAGSQPVRIGNAAHEQFQLDVYGEVMDALHQARVHGLDPDDHAWSLQRNIMDFLEGGVGPARRRHLGGARAAPSLHAFEGARVGRVRPRGRSRSSAGTCAGRSTGGGSCARRSTRRCAARRSTSSSNSFTQAYGSDELDASTLLIPLVGFLPADDPRVVGHDRRDPARSDARRLRRALQASRSTTTSTACRAAKASSCRARSGSSTRC